MSEQQEIREETPIAPAVDLEALMSENAAMKAKMDELLTEAKKAKSAKREIEEQSQVERERIAREKGDFEQLHRSSEERYQATVKELESMRANVANEKRNNAAMKVATELADGANAELLSEFISRRLKYHDDGVKVTDSSGDLTVSTLDDLKAEFKNDAKYSSLFKGNQSSGGGASGGSNSGGAAKVKSRAEFEALDPAGRMSFVKSGGKLTDN